MNIKRSILTLCLVLIGLFIVSSVNAADNSLNTNTTINNDYGIVLDNNTSDIFGIFWIHVYDNQKKSVQGAKITVIDDMHNKKIKYTDSHGKAKFKGPALMGYDVYVSYPDGTNINFHLSSGCDKAEVYPDHTHQHV